jgi:hypothetical protein
VRLWIKPCTRIEVARSSIESPPDLRTLRAEGKLVKRNRDDVRHG